MADPVSGVSGVSAGPGTGQGAEAREIPSDRNVYARQEVSGADGAEESGAFDEALIEAAIRYMATEAIGMLNRGLAESKRQQEEAHSALKEALNEGGES